MALKLIGHNSVPSYIALSTDISNSKIVGASLTGKLVLTTDDGAWYIIEEDQTLSAYALPATFSGTIALGTVDIDQTSAGVSNGVVAGTSAAGSDGIGNYLAVLKAPGAVNSAPLSVIPLVYNGATFDRLRGTVAGGMLVHGNMGRIATEVTPAAQASTSTSTLVTGSILDTLNNLTVAYTILNSGAQSIDWIVKGGNASNLSDGVAVNSSATILTTAYDSYATTAAPFRYYGVFIVDTVPLTHGEATVAGITKG